MEVNTGESLSLMYLQKVFPAAQYLIEQLTDLETTVSSLTYEDCEWPSDAGRSRSKCSDDISDSVVEATSTLAEIAWTVHRLLVLMYRKRKLELTKKALDLLEVTAMLEYGPSTYEGEEIKAVKQPPQLPAPIPVQASLPYVGDELWYQCPHCLTFYEDAQEMAACTCSFDGENWVRKWDTHNHVPIKPQGKPCNPTKYSAAATQLVSAVKEIEGGE